MQPFTITVYEKDSFNITKVRFYYDEGTPKLWIITGLKNGGHDSYSFSDTWNNDYINHEGDIALEVAQQTLKSLIK